MKKGIKKFGAFFIATCIASTMVTSVSAESLSGNTEQHNLIEYFKSFDFSVCYESETLGQDVKEDLKKVEVYISQNENPSLQELNGIIGKIEESNTPITRAAAAYDYSKYLPVSEGQLNSKEKQIFNQNPAAGLIVLAQADYANKSEKGVFGSNSWGTNGDAYRHALWNAMGAKGVGDSYMAAFATAHETGSAGYNPNSIDTQMDLKNNAKGRELLKSMKFPSRPPNGMTIPYIIRNEIAKAVGNGKMVRFVSGGKQYSYLMPTNSSSKN